MKKHLAAAAVTLSALALIAPTASAAPASDHPAGETMVVRDKTGDVTGTAGGHGRVDIAKAVYTVGKVRHSGYKTKTLTARVVFAQKSSNTVRFNDTVRYVMKSGDRTFVLRMRPTDMVLDHQRVPDLSVFERLDNGRHKEIQDSPMDLLVRDSFIEMRMNTHDLTRLGVKQLDTVSVSVTRGDEGARDHTIAAGPVDLT